MARNRVAAIYVISNVQTGEQYVGHSSDVDMRWYWHRAHLARGTHPNSGLQAAWCEHGKSIFMFAILEHMEQVAGRLDMEALEYQWIERLKPAYNHLRTLPKRGHKKHSQSSVTRVVNTSGIADGSGQYVTIREARDILGLHEWSMRKLLEDTKTPLVRLPLDRRGRWLRREDVERLRQQLYQPVGE